MVRQGRVAILGGTGEPGARRARIRSSHLDLDNADPSQGARMSSQQEPIKILAPHSFREKLSRRALFQMGGAAAGLAIVAACGDDKKSSGNTTGATTGGTTA